VGNKNKDEIEREGSRKNIERGWMERKER